MARNGLSRIGTIVKAEVEDVLSRIENPRKLVNQMLIDMERSFDQAVGEVSRAIANEKVIERRLRTAEREIVELQREAEEALRRGDEEAARRALDAKVALETTCANLRESHLEAQSASEQLKRQLTDLRTRLEQARSRRHTVVARRQNYRGQERWRAVSTADLSTNSIG